MFTKQVFFIRDKKTGKVWAHQKWATQKSAPTVYGTESNAQSQIDSGKLGMMLLYRVTSCKPEIISATLTENV